MFLLCSDSQIESGKEEEMRIPVLIAGLWGLAASAQAAETITYSYDARGRLKQAVRSGAVNNGVATSYQFDRAHNRKRKTTTGTP